MNSPVSHSGAPGKLPAVLAVPSRALSTPFVVSTTRDAFVTYSAILGTSTSVALTVTGSGSDTETAQLFLEARPTPGSGAFTAISTCGVLPTLTLSGTLILGVTLTVTIGGTTRIPVSGVIPRGWEVQLRSVVAGGGTVTIGTTQCEVLL